MEYQKKNKLIARTSALIPFTYLTFIGLFFSIVKLSESEFPTYGNPDPKKFPVLLFTSNILMLLIPISFILWFVIIVKSIIDRKLRALQQDVLIGVLGFLLIVLMVQFDPMGILNWLAD